jgi:hypothetical protein
MATAMAATSIVLALVMGFLLYLELHKIEKQVLEIEKHLHHLNNEVNKLKQQAKKKYYSNQNNRQVIKG